MSAEAEGSSEVSIDWRREGSQVIVDASLGGAAVTLMGDLNDGDFATLVNSTPAIMNAVVESINAEEAP